jgi:hypothetical protein
MLCHTVTGRYNGRLADDASVLYRRGLYRGETHKRTSADPRSGPVRGGPGEARREYRDLVARYAQRSRRRSRYPSRRTVRSERGSNGRRNRRAASALALLQAIVRARRWIEAILTDAAPSFAMIAATEGLGERHVRRFAPLAFLSPRVLQAIAEGTARPGTGLWRPGQQIRDIGKSQPETVAQYRAKTGI